MVIYTKVILECIKAWPWSELLASLIGALCAFGLPIWYAKKQEKRRRKDVLVNYFYNLHIMFRNLFGYMNSVERNLKISKEQHVDFIEPQIPTFQFDNSEKDLAFLVETSPKFYEEIVQLKMDLNNLNMVNVPLQKRIRQEYFLSFSFRCMMPGTEIEIMLLNTAKYLKEFYKININNEIVKDNVRRFNVWKEKSLRNISHNNDKQQKDAARDMHKQLEKLKKDWTLDF